MEIPHEDQSSHYDHEFTKVEDIKYYSIDVNVKNLIGYFGIYIIFFIYLCYEYYNGNIGNY